MAGVFVPFNSGLLAALDLDGQVRWRTNLVAGFGPVSLSGTRAPRRC